MAAPVEETRESIISAKKRRLSDSASGKMDDGSVLRFHKLSEFATKPTRGSIHAAGLDLYSAQEVTIPAQGKQCVVTDIQIEIPEGCYGRVAPRSGLAAKHHIDLGAGVIDYDYRGNVGVVMFNLGDKPFQVNVGDRIAQLVLEKIFMPRVEESQTKLPETQRGAGGFGSTGGFQKQNGNTNGHQTTLESGAGDAGTPKSDEKNEA